MDTGPTRRRWLYALLGGLCLAGPASAADDGKKLAIKGRITGGDTLNNPVWLEASDTASHRYFFRTQSTSVSEKARRLTAYLPKELCVAVLFKESGTSHLTAPIVSVSGGRTTP